MDSFGIDPHHLLLLGIVLVILTLLVQLRNRFRKNAEKQAQRQAAIQAAHEAERKRQLQTVIPKTKVGTSSQSSRIPLTDPFGTPFTGGIPTQFAKWEAELHKLGRQITGQIDSKMSALQAVTLDANRTANRLEILVEHLEELARQQIERQQFAAAERLQTERSATVISAAAPAPEAAPLAMVLRELKDDLEGIHKTIEQSTAFSEQIEPVTVLRPIENPEVAEQSVPPSEGATLGLRKEVEMLSNYGYNAKEIARRLNISIGEVDLVLQLRENR